MKMIHVDELGGSGPLEIYPSLQNNISRERMRRKQQGERRRPSSLARSPDGWMGIGGGGGGGGSGGEGQTDEVETHRITVLTHYW
jgi:uncharacterized membrane protein